ncbi:hypothetical protein QVD17_09221 [Tagetes erecta]|uniref:Uncharacterized protein n=1 Tax=Tagetes erecta TaxID=13708 RepID=A0AAD8L3X9_TARER|nr:hypothetical protein QVD17_09221 [Tagetes erecta]
MIMKSAKTSCHKKPMTIATIIKTPVRVISKALDLYVKGVNNFSNSYNRPFVAMDTNSNRSRLPRSFSTGRLSDNDQPQASALVRSISTTATGNMQRFEHHQPQIRSYRSRKGVSRSCSVGMGKIDEDRVSSFRDNDFSSSYSRVSSKRSKFM